jgi:hypothetical protein
MQAEMLVENGKKLSTAIQATIRITKAKKPPKYIDARNNVESVLAEANHVLFGRRGSGKSALMFAAKDANKSKTLSIFIDCEDLKDRPYPDVILEILIQINKQIIRGLGFKALFFSPTGYFALWKLSRTLVKLKQRPLVAEKEIAEEFSTHLSAETEYGGAGLSKKTSANETKKFVKLEAIRRDISEWRDTIDEACRKADIKKVLIFIDDFYQLPSERHAEIADIVHRICKQSRLYFKVSTIRHRSQLYKEEKGQPFGIQSVHDYQAVDLDFSLERFTEARDALRAILCGIAETVDMTPDDVAQLFMGKGFDRLVEASGGVPRDFLSLLASYLNNSLPQTKQPLGKDAVRDLAGNYFQAKRTDMNTDAEKGESEQLMTLFDRINDFCLEKKKNTFMIDRDLASDDKELYQRILKLADFRLIHRISSSRSNPTVSGKSFDTYMLDIGCYSYMRKLSGKLNEIDLTKNEKTLIDELRTAPIFEPSVTAVFSS